MRFSAGLAEVSHLACGAGKLQDVHAGVRAIHDVNISAVVHLNVIRLDRDFAALAGSTLASARSPTMVARELPACTCKTSTLDTRSAPNLRV